MIPTLATGLILMSAAPLPQTLKDDAPRFRPRQVQELPPTPQRGLSFVYIEGGGDIRLPMSEAEMERYGYMRGQTIPLSAARRIVEEKLIKLDEEKQGVGR